MAKKIVEVQQPQETQARHYFGQQALDHDLFKLKVAPMIKNTSYEGQAPKYVEVEHCHIMKVAHNKDGIPTVTCSPAMKYVRTKINGRLQRVAVQVPEDTHEHEMEYMGSHKIQPRQMNAEGAKAIAALEAPYKSTVADLERDFGRKSAE